MWLFCVHSSLTSQVSNIIINDTINNVRFNINYTDVQGQLAVTTFPDTLFDGEGYIVEGSVVWLYCEVNSTSPALTVTWEKDEPLVQDVPHIRLRSSHSDTSTTFILIVDDFQTSDSGVYQCTAQEGREIATGTAFTLIGEIMGCRPFL